MQWLASTCIYNDSQDWFRAGTFSSLSKLHVSTPIQIYTVCMSCVSSFSLVKMFQASLIFIFIFPCFNLL